MMIQCGAMVIPCSCMPLLRPICIASGINTEQLRAQLDQLHAEAVKTRAKANNARLRLMRLSEAAEKFRRQAAVSVQTGKENDARELLFQKMKIMQALEKSKSRIELFNELSAKLNEAISVKETQLIGNVALDLELDREDAGSPVRIISPIQEVAEDGNEDEGFGTNAVKLSDDLNLQIHADRKKRTPVDEELEDFQGSLSVGICNEDKIINCLGGISSFEDFLEHLDQQLNKIEAELVTVLNVSTMVLNNEEKPKNLKLQQTMEVLESIRGIRQRIITIVRTKLEIS